MEKILLDTDIGSDIDDAVCLAYLLMQPDCELTGITTVLGETDARCRLASALCYAAGKDIPLYPGARRAILDHTPPSEVSQLKGLGGWPHRTDFPQGEWLAFMQDTIRRHPGEITLLAIGPMTNVGLLFAYDPELPALLKRLVLMCGAFTDRFSHIVECEWNARCDPYATAMVYHAAAPVHRSVGLDVTFQVNLSKEEVSRRFRHPVLQPVLDFAGVWFEEADVITFHDPLTAVGLFVPEVLTYARGQVHVELCNTARMGLTRLRRAENGPHEVAETVDVGGFFDAYFSVFR